MNIFRLLLACFTRRFSKAYPKGYDSWQEFQIEMQSIALVEYDELTILAKMDFESAKKRGKDIEAKKAEYIKMRNAVDMLNMDIAVIKMDLELLNEAKLD